MEQLEEQFFGEFFEPADQTGTLLPKEAEVLEWCEKFVQDRFGGMKYILGSAIDFLLLAQSLRRHDASLAAFDAKRSEKSIFAAYELVTQRGAKQANTLTLRYGGKQFGIRKLEELVMKYFYAQRRLGYPSAYVYNTGQWHKYIDLLEHVFQLSAFGRHQLLLKLLSFGNSQIEVKTLDVLVSKDMGDFERILKFYERSNLEENGGLAFQAMAYGIASVIYGHMNISASSVRTGSARQSRFGDIDAYAGAQLAVSIEVKDIELTSENYQKEIGAFVEQVSSVNARGLVFCRDCEHEVEKLVCGSAPTLQIVRDSALLQTVKLWDDRQQQRAVEGTQHFLANVEHNTLATRRLAEFLAA